MSALTPPGGRLRPLCLHWGREARHLVREGVASALLGGRCAASLFELLRRNAGGDWENVTLEPGTVSSELPVRALVEPLAAPRPAPFDRPRIMAVLNVTPDSFSDGGRWQTHEAAIARGRELIHDGADIVDVGGESTRPGAAPVPDVEQIGRVLPVVEALATEGAFVSVDTRSARVAEAALRAGARMVNDVSCLRHDPAMASVVAAADAFLILTHSRGAPADMMAAANYRHCALEVCEELAQALACARTAGVPAARLIADPGLCFAKREAHNLDVLRRLTLYHALGVPLAIGVSRKGITRRLESEYLPSERLPASLALAWEALRCGVTLLRVHDVRQTRQVVDLFLSLTGDENAAS